MTDQRAPEYVTDGDHIYLWHPEYACLLENGTLKPSNAPEVKKAKPLTARQKAKLEAARKLALKTAEDTVKLFKHSVPSTDDSDILFGAPPQ